MKIAILGYSGGGKSYLADSLSQLNRIPVMHLDTVKYDKHWNARNKDVVLNEVSAFMKQENWIIDGNYSALYQKERLLKADRIIIVKLSALKCFYNCIKREKEYRKNGFVNSLNLEFISFVLFGGRTKKRRLHYKDIEVTHNQKTTVIKSKRRMNKFIKEWEERYGTLCKQNGNT